MKLSFDFRPVNYDYIILCGKIKLMLTVERPLSVSTYLYNNNNDLFVKRCKITLQVYINGIDNLLVFT